MPPRLAWAITFGFCSCSAALGQSVWRVDADASPGGDGLSWTSAFADLQDALAAAHAQPPGVLQEIWIAEGIYLPDSGSGDRTAAFTFDRPVRLLGGFTGTEANAADRVGSTPSPVLSGDIGAVAVRADNSLHVVRLRDGSSDTLLERVVIRDGNADDAGISFGRSGGGVLVEDGSPTIDLCIIESCTARDGAGLFVDTGAPFVHRSLIRQNVATTSGGGAYLADGGTIDHCVFDANTAPSGGGLFVCCGGGNITGTLFQGNFGTNGGGCFLGVGGPPITRCVFVSNAATRGAGVYASRSGGSIVSCRFASNTATDGGGIYFDLGATAVNCIFTRNTAFSFGGGIYARNNPTIVGCLLHSNAASFTGGGIHHASGTTALANSILWNNTDSAGLTQQGQIIRVSGTLTPQACCIQAWTGSLGGSFNFGESPQFIAIAGVDGLIGTADDDPRVGFGSPCIDSGNNTLWPQDAADIDNDGDTLEVVPLDAPGSARALDEPSIPDSGVPGNGLPAIADIGAAEFLPGCVGDLNNDLLVNAADFTILAGNFGVLNASFGQGDINGDTAVNAADFTIFASRFGAECP